MAKTKSSPRKVDYGFNPLELAEVIYASLLPEGKKLAYLYMIADGSFSLSHFDGLLEEIDRVGVTLEQRRKVEEAKLKALKKHQEQLEKELIELQMQAAEEQQRNVDHLLEVVSKETEQQHETVKKKKIRRIKTKLRKQK